MIIKNIKKIFPPAAGLGFLSTSVSALAAEIKVDLTKTGVGVPATTEVGTVIANAIKIVFVLALIAALAMLIYGAFEWIISGGEKEKVGNARNRITSALIGLAILGLSFVIITFVGKLVGIDNIFDLKIPTLGNK